MLACKLSRNGDYRLRDKVGALTVTGRCLHVFLISVICLREAVAPQMGMTHVCSGLPSEWSRRYSYSQHGSSRHPALWLTKEQGELRWNVRRLATKQVHEVGHKYITRASRSWRVSIPVVRATCNFGSITCWLTGVGIVCRLYSVEKYI